MNFCLYLILVTPLVEQVWPELEGLNCKDELVETDRICCLLLRRVRTANANNMQMKRYINVCGVLALQEMYQSPVCGTVIYLGSLQSMSFFSIFWFKHILLSLFNRNGLKHIKKQQPSSKQYKFKPSKRYILVSKNFFSLNFG